MAGCAPSLLMLAGFESKAAFLRKYDEVRRLESRSGPDMIAIGGNHRREARRITRESELEIYNDMPIFYNTQASVMVGLGNAMAKYVGKHHNDLGLLQKHDTHLDKLTVSAAHSKLIYLMLCSFCLHHF